MRKQRRKKRNNNENVANEERECALDDCYG